MVSGHSLTYSYDNHRVFRYPNLFVESGHPMLITGRSGSGKTTLLHIISGLLAPAFGRLLVNGVNIYELSDSRRDIFRGRHIGIVLQKHHFVKGLSVQDNIGLSGYFGSLRERIQRERLAKSLAIDHLLAQDVQTLSEGEQQRVSIARALNKDCKLLVADEPTSSLDDENAFRVAEMLCEQATLSHAALIVVTHDQRLRPFFKNILEIV